MNRSKIDWADHTWNPITGCYHGCSYCYARKGIQRFCGDVRRNKMAKDSYRTVPSADGKHELYVLDEPMKNETGNDLVYPFGFEPTFHRHRMNTMDKLKNGNNIFVGAMADIFGDWIPEEWITEIFDYCRDNPIHNYMFLTKNPKRYLELEEKKLLPWGENFWYGTTITNPNQTYAWFENKTFHWFLSIEPILEDMGDLGNDVIPDWIIVGAESGQNKRKVVPKKEWIDNIVEQCDRFHIPVFMKESLREIVGDENMRQEYPPQLQRKELSEKMKKKLYDVCCKCGAYMKKSDMITLMAKSVRKEIPKQYGYMCGSCFTGFCKSCNVEVPELEILSKSEE